MLISVYKDLDVMYFEGDADDFLFINDNNEELIYCLEELEYGKYGDKIDYDGLVIIKNQ